MSDRLTPPPPLQLKLQQTEIIEIVTYIVVSIFDESSISVLRSLFSMKLAIGPYAQSFGKNVDDQPMLSTDGNEISSALAAIFEQQP